MSTGENEQMDALQSVRIYSPALIEIVEDGTQVFGNGLTRADIRDIVGTVFGRRAERRRRSADNCLYVREQMRVREPRIHAAYEKAVRDACHDG